MKTKFGSIGPIVKFVMQKCLNMDDCRKVLSGPNQTPNTHETHQAFTNVEKYSYQFGLLHTASGVTEAAVAAGGLFNPFVWGVFVLHVIKYASIYIFAVVGGLVGSKALHGLTNGATTIEHDTKEIIITTPDSAMKDAVCDQVREHYGIGRLQIEQSNWKMVSTKTGMGDSKQSWKIVMDPIFSEKRKQQMVKKFEEQWESHGCSTGDQEPQEL